MLTRFRLSKSTKGEDGFTLVEMIAVLAIIGIIGAVAIPKFVDLGATSAMTALYHGVSELNGRESMLWAKMKTSENGWQSDANIFSQLDTELGNEFKWTPSAQIDGAKLHLKEKALTLDRVASTRSSPGVWVVTKEN
jgi:prepilin-type N-terminal cleavage/methylation domain-containing protein